jgi:arginine decarboxylase
MADVVKPLAYNSVWQLRADAWSRLEEVSERLATGVAADGSMEQATGQTRYLLGLLDPIESYWAFPGNQRFDEVKRLFDVADFGGLAHLVAGVNRALVTDSYRRVSWPSAGVAGEADELDVGGEEPTLHRPYFEVLVVEDMTAPQERALREELRRLRRPDDEFVYELVIVPSFDDAGWAVWFNYNLQACVIRRRFVHRSRHDLAQLGFMKTQDAEGLMERPPDERAQMLGRWLSRLRPELDLYLMTEASIEDIAGRLSRHFRRVFHAREGSLELHLSLLRGVGEWTSAGVKTLIARPSGIRSHSSLSLPRQSGPPAPGRRRSVR